MPCDSACAAANKCRAPIAHALRARHPLGMLIPPTSLPPATLRGIIEDFITREGTHYGQSDEATLDEKVAVVMRQLDRGDVAISFDPETETVSLTAEVAQA